MVAQEYYIVQVLEFAIPTFALLLGTSTGDGKTAFAFFLIGVVVSILLLPTFVGFFMAGA